MDAVEQGLDPARAEAKSPSTELSETGLDVAAPALHAGAGVLGGMDGPAARAGDAKHVADRPRAILGGARRR